MAQRGLTPAPLVVVEGQTDRAMVLSLIGELDLAAAPRLVSAAADALRRGRDALVLDLTEVAFVDSAGLAALLNVLRRATTAGAALVLVGVAPPITAVFSRTRLDRAFTFADTQADAERVAADTR
jgi:anti-anti-sigma factor